jgi:hypothetical protein
MRQLPRTSQRRRSRCLLFFFLLRATLSFRSLSYNNNNNNNNNNKRVMCSASSDKRAFQKSSTPASRSHQLHGVSDANTVVEMTEPTKSVHLQLNPTRTEAAVNEDTKKDAKSKSVTIHTYVDPRTKLQWTALDTGKRKFVAFLKYNNVHVDDDNNTEETSIRTQVIDQSNNLLREEWRTLWKQRRLVTDRTELLAVYPSDTASSNVATTTSENENSNGETLPKRGGFGDLLSLYVERLVSILQDEQYHLNSHLVTWLQTEYGHELTLALQKSSNPTKESFKHFLEWFRKTFPYYYDRCGTCGASKKEDLANARIEKTDVRSAVEKNCNGLEGAHRHECEDSPVACLEDGEMLAYDEEEVEHQTFVGYIYPDTIELTGKASRTELYQCHSCQAFTRFPRFNSAQFVLNTRRGRCGEYSMLLFRFLRALGHECRWVVDYADHVWAEIDMSEVDGQRRWVHLDPCEAAMDENLLYKGWGKKQTYILAFYAPAVEATRHKNFFMNGYNSSVTSFPLIQDVTQTYTDEDWTSICKRRDETDDQVEAAIERSIDEMKAKLSSLHVR